MFQRVEVSFSENIPSKNPRPDILDLSQNEGQIITEALLFQEKNPEPNVVSLTDDTHADILQEEVI